MIFGAIYTSFANFVHWMFCYIYLKLQIEVKYLLDSRIYTTNQDIILKRNRENFCLEVVNILNALISVGILAGDIWMDDFYNYLIDWIVTGLELVYLVTWSYSLWSLFTKFKSSKHLLPRSRVYITHAILITAYLLCQIISTVMEEILVVDTCD